jgi:hypothetical protein
MSPVGYELEIPASERSQTHALDRAATGIVGVIIRCITINVYCVTENSPYIVDNYILVRYDAVFTENFLYTFRRRQ